MHPLTRSERFALKRKHSGDDWAKRFNLRMRRYYYTGWGWFKDAARRDFLATRCR